MLSRLVHAQESLSQPLGSLEDTTVYTWVDRMPVFGDCDPADDQAGICSIKAMTRYLFQNLRYPQASMARNTGGLTKVEVILDKQGRITSARISESSGTPELDTEALRLVKAMVDWSPGRQGGFPVRVRMTIPVNFIPEAYRRE